jgi:hypothetical protein
VAHRVLRPELRLDGPQHLQLGGVRLRRHRDRGGSRRDDARVLQAQGLVLTAGDDPEREEQVESRWEATPAVAVLIGAQVLLALVSHNRGWTIWDFGWWLWLIPVVPESLLLIALGWSRPRHRLEQMGIRRTAAVTLLGILSAANVFIVIALVAALVNGGVHSGGQLLFEAIVVWGTNVIAFGLWYWAVDQGGPVRRHHPDPPPPDFQFPQLENPQLAEPGWYPKLFDYLYISFTNSIAFSPTDAMPLSRRAKALMLAESATSAVTVLLVAARAVNIFT